MCTKLKINVTKISTLSLAAIYLPPPLVFWHAQRKIAKNSKCSLKRKKGENYTHIFLFINIL